MFYDLKGSLYKEKSYTYFVILMRRRGWFVNSIPLNCPIKYKFMLKSTLKIQFFEKPSQILIVRSIFKFQLSAVCHKDCKFLYKLIIRKSLNCLPGYPWQSYSIGVLTLHSLIFLYLSSLFLALRPYQGNSPLSRYRRTYPTPSRSSLLLCSIPK